MMMINNAIAVNSMDKLRYAQDVALYAMDLAEGVPSFSEETSRKTWLEDPLWQPSRENVELLSASGDWGEQVLATNVVSEPLVTAPFRTSFNIPFAAVHRDVGDSTALRLQEYLQAQPILGLLANQRFLSI